MIIQIHPDGVNEIRMYVVQLSTNETRNQRYSSEYGTAQVYGYFK